MLHPQDDNKAFEQAAAFVKYTARHLFLTGKAGTGKTTFLKWIKDNCSKKMAIVAPTGVAAINASGVTIHSFFQLPIGTYIHNYRTAWGEYDHHIFNKNQLLSKLRLNQNKRTLINELELLIIDEISMVRADVMDAIDAVLRSVRRKPQLPFGGVQMLYIGDLFQLPPVVRQHDKNLLDDVYQSPFFFDALVMQEAEPVYLELKKIYRQQDSAFISLLNNIRNNNATQDDLDLLHEYYNPDFMSGSGDGYITLTSHNYQADNINQKELERLNGQLYKVEAAIDKDFPEHLYPADKALMLKQGAQIMFIRNDKGEQRKYYNGKIGIIEKIEDNGDTIFIRFRDEPERLRLNKETWRNIRYGYDETDDAIKEEVLGTFTQFPIRLAWAVTIHKSQGLTFEKAIIDAGQSFAPGQVYVALSRLTGLSGLVLRSRIYPNAIMTDERIIDFSKNESSGEAMLQSLQLAQKEYVLDCVKSTFDFEKIQEQFTLHFQDTNYKKLADGDHALQWSFGLRDDVEQLRDTADKFQLQLEALIAKGTPAYPQLQQRVAAAVQWFTPLLRDKIIVPLELHLSEMRIKQRTKKYVTALQVILLSAIRKQVQLEQSMLIINDIAASKDWNSVMNQLTLLQSPQVAVKDMVKEDDPAAGPAPGKGSSKIISLEMYQSGKSIEEIAAERGYAVSTIAGHLIAFIGSGELDVKAFVTEEKLAVISQAIRQDPEASLSFIKSAIGDSCSYEEIRAVQQYEKRMREGNQQAGRL